MPERKLVMSQRACLAENVAGCCAIVDATRVLQRQWPRKPGPFAESIISTLKSCGRDRGVRNGLFSGPYRPNQGRSPLRTEMRALAASKRSIEAIRRLKIPVDGGELVEAVLDILVPFYSWAATRCVVMGINLGI